MRLDEVMLLADDALNLAIEYHCYGRLWEPRYLDVEEPDPADPWRDKMLFQYERRIRHLIRSPQDDIILRIAVDDLPDYVGDWVLCIPLAWRYGIAIHPPLARRAAFVHLEDRFHPDIPSATEVEARRAICQLALWQATRDHETRT